MSLQSERRELRRQNSDGTIDIRSLLFQCGIDTSDVLDIGIATHRN